MLAKIAYNKAKYDEVHAIKLLNDGDASAFNVLFDHYASKLFNFSRNLTQSREDAEEIVQETFLKVWENREKVRSDLSFNAYLITIAKHIIFNKTKRRVLEKSFVKYYQDTNNHIDWNTEEQIERNDLDNLKNSMMSTLPERRRQIMILRKDGYTNEDVADLLKISKSTVANQVNRAIKDLQKLIKALIVFIALLIDSTF